MTLTRRRVLAAGSITVAFALVRPGAAQDAARRVPPIDAWIRIDAEGNITVFTGKAELGQGLKTALVQIAADELAVAAEAIELVTADTERTPNEGVTAGSRSMQDSGTSILRAAGTLRQMLVEAAAWRLVTSADQVSLRDGRALGPEGRSVGYGELVSGMQLNQPARADAPRRAERRLIGTSLPRIDIPAKLTGGAAYVQDMRLPGLLHGRVVRGPHHGTELDPDGLAAEATAIAKLPGIVNVVRDGRFTAVIATDEWRAIKAMRRLQAVGWKPAPPTAGAPEPVPIFEQKGPPPPEPARTLAARYSRPWLMHGSIGPSCAIALWENESVKVWTHSQGVGPLRQSLAEMLRLSARDVRCIHVEGSGCYGHNGADDVAADAALAARAVPGWPVRLQWMREQEHGWEPLGSAMRVELRAALGPDGRIADWRHEVWSHPHSTRPTTAGGLLAARELEKPFAAPVPRPIPMPEGGGSRNGVPIYAVGNGLGVYQFTALSPLRASALRGLGAHMNVFAIESFMDELAALAGADPVAFRRAHLADPRALAVVDRVAERFGWTKRAKGSGFAFARYKNLAAYCAVALQVEVDRDSGAIRVGRVVAAVDSGEAINPDGIRNQIEGGIVQSLSWTIHEALALESGGRASFDWSAYPILRFGDAPASIEVEVLDRPGLPFLGTGEAAQGPAAAALANAVADAMGRRLRDMPFAPERLKALLAG